MRTKKSCCRRTSSRRSGGACSGALAAAEVLHRPGHRLDGPTRASMEARFGHDFGRVRIHADRQAARAARGLDARAFTVGRHLVFGRDEYAPGSEGGRALLAHELAHAVQQRQRDAARVPARIAPPSSAVEREAGSAARRVVSGDPPPTLTAGRAQIARQEDDGDAADDGGDDSSCALATYTGSNFVGESVTADVEFVDSLNTINDHASANDVDVHVTSSFRTTTKVEGAIVEPATKSNHLAGHAIDMNVKYGPKKGSWCNSTCLSGDLPEGVKGFIEAIQEDAGLRWGGDFSDEDPVHIDDHLNADSAAWKARYQATQKAREDGCG